MKIQRILYAPNVHQGGGKSLLLLLLQELKEAADMVFVLDARIQLPTDCKLEGTVYRVKPTLLSRLSFEVKICSLITDKTLLLCMGNLPPLFAHKGNQLVFLQNCYLIDKRSTNLFTWKVRGRLLMERWWLYSKTRYVKKIIVQTLTMKHLVKKELGVDAEVRPFSPAQPEQSEIGLQKKYNFIYVASGEPHKNHCALIEAWVLLAHRGLFPSLCLTLNSDNFPELLAFIEEKKSKYHLRVDNLGELSSDELKLKYLQSEALIYPSTLESFGLPLIEAKDAGLKIVASELDFVRDNLDPDESFNPLSSISIARAVGRLMGYGEDHVQLTNAKDFLQNVFPPITSLDKEK